MSTFEKIRKQFYPHVHKRVSCTSTMVFHDMRNSYFHLMDLKSNQNWFSFYFIVFYLLFWWKENGAEVQFVLALSLLSITTVTTPSGFHVDREIYTPACLLLRKPVTQCTSMYQLCGLWSRTHNNPAQGVSMFTWLLGKFAHRVWLQALDGKMLTLCQFQVLTKINIPKGTGMMSNPHGRCGNWM